MGGKMSKMIPLKYILTSFERCYTRNYEMELTITVPPEVTNTIK